MNSAFLDTSCAVSIALRERGSAAIDTRLRSFAQLYGSPLLEAELHSALRREKIAFDPTLLSAIQWVHANRLLSAEIARVLQAGYVRGADCWHLATALYLAPNPAEITFLTLDLPQRKIASALGFKT
ncbi:MAG: PIN domain-containing protein [bacterium]